MFRKKKDKRRLRDKRTLLILFLVNVVVGIEGEEGERKEEEEEIRRYKKVLYSFRYFLVSTCHNYAKTSLTSNNRQSTGKILRKIRFRFTGSLVKGLKRVFLLRRFMQIGIKIVKHKITRIYHREKNQSIISRSLEIFLFVCPKKGFPKQRNFSSFFFDR